MATDDDDGDMRVIRATMAMTMTMMTTIRAPNRLAFATEDGNRKLLRFFGLLFFLDRCIRCGSELSDNWCGDASNVCGGIQQRGTHPCASERGVDDVLG